MRLADSPPTRETRRGFTVVELLLAVAIMTVIVLGLYTVFDQTQRALRGTLSQVDVLEGIRATTDLMARDLEGAVPFDRTITQTNLAASVNPLTDPIELQGLAGANDPIFQTVIQDIFFVTRRNNEWTAIGYWVGPVSTNQAGQRISLGRLHRFQFTVSGEDLAAADLYSIFRHPDFGRLNSSPVMDGVVHLRLIAYSADGRPMLHESNPLVGRYQIDYYRFPGAVFPASWIADPARNSETAYYFQSSREPPFPFALEIEIGVVEPQVVRRFASIPVATEARKFLARNSGQIHLFRQRIPLRNATSLLP
jgi:prepilin-type N-terminal cleavage/methylation domain-containing protein